MMMLDHQSAFWSSYGPNSINLGPIESYRSIRVVYNEMGGPKGGYRGQQGQIGPFSILLRAKYHFLGLKHGSNDCMAYYEGNSNHSSSF